MGGSFRDSRRGFTLVELMISAALMGVILAAGYACLSAALATQKLMDPRLEAAQGARVVLDRMAAELRSACALPGDSEFLGVDRTVGGVEADSLDFATHHFTPTREGEGDYCAVSYFIEQDERTGLLALCRRSHPGLPLEGPRGGRKDVMVTGIRALRIEHYDGFEWYESWGDTEGRGKAESSRRERSNLTGMPEAVRITLALDPNPRRRRGEDSAGSESEAVEPEPAMVFQTVARLVLASVPSASGGSGAATPGATPEGGGN
ncbi:MAG: prepilin-type N-terminal cleavage/methylation domain-containing protein [Verrucomicrobiales bacterium]|nr:prepilin-type N-terminal cleavage/methylation domain-containing protein [Verrucomicrobiales bacterium]